jgi:hypothetical protein
MSKFYSHVAQSAEADYANFLAFGDAPVMHGGVCRDAGTEQRRGCGGMELGGDAQDEVFIDDDAFGVAAVGHASEMLVPGVEGEDHIRAELFEASFAIRARAVRVDHTAHRGEIAGLVLGNRRADLRDTTDDLMTRDNRIVGRHELAPFVPDRMQIGVADAAEEDLDLHVAFSRFATVDLGGSQRRCRTAGGVSFRVVGCWMHNGLISFQRFNFQLSTYCQSGSDQASTSLI